MKRPIFILFFRAGVTWPCNGKVRARSEKQNETANFYFAFHSLSDFAGILTFYYAPRPKILLFCFGSD